MKSLILLLLVAIPVQAQSLADIARQERARKAQVKSSRSFNTQDVRGAEASGGVQTPAAPDPNAAKPSAPSAPAGTATPASPAAPGPNTVDLVKKYNEDLEKLRTGVRDLQDQEAAAQLQLNAATNQFLSPVTDTEMKQVAQGRMAEARGRLDDVRSQLQKARDQLAALEAQGPPKK